MYFILMPDAISSRQCRALLANENKVNVKVGTSLSLFEQIAELWLLEFDFDQATAKFDESLKRAAYKLSNSFWYKSLITDESTTLHELSASIKHVFANLPLSQQFEDFSCLDAPTRVKNYWQDLIALSQEMHDLRPAEQAFAKQWFDLLDTCEPLESFEIIIPKSMSLPVWLQQAVECLNKNISLCPTSDTEHTALQAMVDEIYDSQPCNSSLGALALGLFSADKTPLSISLDNELSIISARDAWEECQTLVSRLQTLLYTTPVALADIAIVLPKQSPHLGLLHNLLSKAGIRFSSLNKPSNEYQWDLQLLKELIALYVIKKQSEKLVDPLQYASVLVNPLMPWSLSYGQSKFRSYKKEPSEFLKHLETSDNKTEKQVVLLNLLFSPWAEHSTLTSWLDNIAKSLRQKKGSNSLTSFKKQLDEIRDIITDESEESALLSVARHLQPTTISSDSSEHWLVDSVLLLTEQDTLLKPVEHLFILGFNQGSYQATPSIPGVFQIDQWRALAKSIETTFIESKQSAVNGTVTFDLLSPLLKDSEFINNFKRLFNKTKSGVHISLSEQTFSSERLLPSYALQELAILLQSEGSIEPDDLVLPIKRCPQNVPFLSYESGVACTDASSSIEQSSELDLGVNLLALHTDKDGNQKPESPSSLNDMMLSPLAWLLKKQHIIPQPWEVATLDARVKGLVVHCVFEHHFKGTFTDFDILFNHAIEKEAPFLDQARWRLDKKALKSETEITLNNLVEWCDNAGWSSDMQEQKLTGKYFGIPIKGTVDAVFKKNNQRLILDYKTRASKELINCINQGFDLQTKLYTEMIKQINVDANVEYVSGYYSTKDSEIVSDKDIENKPGSVSVVPPKNPIQSPTKMAEDTVAERLAKLREGKVMLNQAGDTKEWDKRGISLMKYVLNDNPLVRAFQVLSVAKLGEATNAK
ncbi:PD-(D/E)XK nuclease family protein [Vibrio sp. 1F255]|uniref:PD-(D/E)XK nuclease family protein n=1 Tax=Vibrio sp. 1F255 TaxID=3230009 RepID=UPI00352C2EB7